VFDIIPPQRPSKHALGEKISRYLLLADALIATAALEYGETFYTKNVRHFRMIPALMVVRPY
jgi:predicted nucleic acid-binding protein